MTPRSPRFRRSFRLAALLACTAFATPLRADDLADGFRAPPQSARPRVWWHWMNGNVTKDGIDKDLDWLARMGIGGVQNFDASLMTPQIVPERLIYMTDGWKDAFRHAVKQADAKGLEFAIAASPGWSETGGPWVKPQHAMKKLVWAQADLRGGQRWTGALPVPPSITGPFQSVAYSDPLAGDAPVPAGPTFYGDALVLAYPVVARVLPVPVVTQTDGRPIDAAPLGDASLDSAAAVAKGTPTQPGGLILDYGKPVTVRSASLFIPHARPPFGDPDYRPLLEAETPGGWQRIGALPLTEVATTIAFAPVTARRFRLVLAPNTGPKSPGLGDGAPGATMMNVFARPASDTLAIGDLRLSAEARIDQFEAKAGFAIAPDYNRLSDGTMQDVPTIDAAIDPARVIDLTGHLRPDGTLDWTAPRGSDWRILRLGYSLTGKTNHPATPEATGLEVDKYDPAAVRRYLETYLAQYRDTVGAEWMGQKGIRALLTDSIEVGASNWTPQLVAQFRQRRGYDPTPFLPTLTGALVGSARRSDAFLHDFRQTLADLLADAHYGTIAKVAHEQGLIVYGEALENGRPVLGDDLALRAHADVPMAAMWTYNRGAAPRPTLIGDMKGAASVAHIYGQNIVSAESLTSAFSPWAFAPSDLKRVIDLEFASGVNRPIIHTSVHQPVDDKVPGLSLMVFGQYFNRHESWAEMARPWVDYMARTGFLLQQGRDHADIAFFHGEDAPITALFEQGVPPGIPTRYAYDFVNADILANRIRVEDGELVATGGARYRALYLGGSSRVMTLATLHRIAALVEDGATLIGTKPERSPGLRDDPAAFRALADRLWSGAPVGKGRVIAGTDVEAALATIGLGPDFHITGGAADSDYRFVHRKLADGDIYFVTNRHNRAEKVEARFRVTGRQPELWRAMTGTAEPLSYRTEGPETVVPLDMGAEDAVFILFRKPAAAPARMVVTPSPTPVATLTAPWTVRFQAGRGAPPRIVLPTLAPLDRHADRGVRYFSGIATYSSSFTAPRTARPGAPLWLDLGKVGDVAEVRINGRLAGTSWFAPYRLDIAPFVKAARNTIEVKVANLWVNRLIGDAQPGAQKITFTAAPTYQPDAPLRPSGLIGPVTLLSGE
ncbi:glycoside hydrolase [Sphingobium sufflavum]|uniref:glycosyl hydrolase n=1 Tax=Sphingobium sufflavum TaxID=1129547 RepID=UPI001F2BC2A7|nr:glycosyl hydrolase [Sphingobium sufflavum]MCE7798040.1 glycoside hydrolase [Sphingobium sufflavum]